jgi:hypothetical protein
MSKMRLCRTTRKGDPKHCENREGLHLDSSGRVTVKFNRFGEDSDWRSRWPNFTVDVDWKDVEALIAKFQGMGHPKALRIKEALKVAVAIEKFVKKTSSPQSS